VCASTPVHHEQIVRKRVSGPGKRMRRVCTDTPHHEHIVRNRVAGLGQRTRRVRAGTMVHFRKRSGSKWPGQGGRCGECVRVHRYTVSKQSGNEGPGPAAEDPP
jgi:hypothetical protein